MRVLVVVVSILLWTSPSLAEQKAPDGFGPIKFGMTKEEAWEAIEGQGEWDGDTLVHKIGIPGFMTDFYDVRQEFVGGFAHSLIVQNTDHWPGVTRCVLDLAVVLGVITNKYKIAPIYLEYREHSIPNTKIRNLNIYQFHYYDDSFIQVYKSP